MMFFIGDGDPRALKTAIGFPRFRLLGGGVGDWLYLNPFRRIRESLMENLRDTSWKVEVP